MSTLNVSIRNFLVCQGSKQATALSSVQRPSFQYSLSQILFLVFVAITVAAAALNTRLNLQQSLFCHDDNKLISHIRYHCECYITPPPYFIVLAQKPPDSSFSWGRFSIRTRSKCTIKISNQPNKLPPS